MYLGLVIIAIAQFAACEMNCVV